MRTKMFDRRIICFVCMMYTFLLMHMMWRMRDIEELEGESVVVFVKLERSLSALKTLEREYAACLHALNTHKSTEDKLRRLLEIKQRHYAALRQEMDELLAEVQQKNNAHTELENEIRLMSAQNEYIRDDRDALLAEYEQQTDVQVASEANLLLLQADYEKLQSIKEDLLVRLKMARVSAEERVHGDNNTLWEDLTTKSNNTRDTPRETKGGFHGDNNTLREDLTTKSNHTEDYTQ